MKKLSSILIIALFFAACSSNQEQQVNSSEEDMLVATPVQNNTIEAWQGNLNGNIPVILWFKKFDDVLSGSLYYTSQKNPKPIKVIGTISEQNYTLYEFMSDGNITGIWSLDPQPSSAEGTWFSPENKNTLSCSLMHIDTAAVVKDISLPNNVAGTYTYQYGKDGGTGNIDIEQIDSNHIVVNISNVTAGPAYNLADIENDTLQLNKNIAIHKSDEFGLCEYQLTFYTDFVNVTYRNNSYDCGFGHRATVNGMYIKTHVIKK